MRRVPRSNKTEQQGLVRKRQKYEKFLPTLRNRQALLQIEINRVTKDTDESTAELHTLELFVARWIDLFADTDVPLETYFRVERVVITTNNIAGVKVPVLEDVETRLGEYDPLTTPLWVDDALHALEEKARLQARLEVLAQQRVLLEAELRRTSQRANLLERRLIPKATLYIRRIANTLSDQDRMQIGNAKGAVKLRKERDCSRTM